MTDDEPTPAPTEDDLPGSLALAIAIKGDKWPHTMDAREWAREWAETIAKHPEVPNDEGSMIGWFANAIMAGYDQANLRRSPTPARSPADELHAETIRLVTIAAMAESACERNKENDLITAEQAWSEFASHIIALDAALSAPAGETRAPEVEKAREWINEIRAWALGSAGATKKDILEYSDRALALLDQAPGAQARAHEDDARGAFKKLILGENPSKLWPNLQHLWQGVPGQWFRHGWRSAGGIIEPPPAQAHTEKPAL